jgi:hypothetical protein
MLRFSALLLAAVLLFVARPAAAQRTFFLTDGCAPLPACEGTACPDSGDHPITLLGMCFCAPGDAGDPPPIPCCSAAVTTCPTGSTCRLFADGTRGGLCIPPGVTYCGDAGAGIDTFAIPCHTTPEPTPTRTIVWRDGDCDADGIANGFEVDDPLRDPCCHDDYDCCIAAGNSEAECCTVAQDSFACCAATGDPVTCCRAQALYSECCLVAAEADEVSMLECCAGSPVTPALDCCSFTDGLTGEACCMDLGGPPELCCELGITTCETPDANVTTPDAGVVVGTDAGGEPMDAGPEPEAVQFGGGGGCVCSAAAPRAPSALALLVALGVAIPVAVRRRR